LPKPQLPIFLPAKSAGDVMPLVGERHLERAGALVDLGDVHDVRPGLPARERLRHPREREVDLAVGELCLRDDLDAALDDLDVEAHALVEALVDRRVVAGELGLDEPLQLQLDRIGRLALGRLRHRSSAAVSSAIVSSAIVSSAIVSSAIVSSAIVSSAAVSSAACLGCRVSAGSSSSPPHAAATSDSAANAAAASCEPPLRLVVLCFMVLLLPRGLGPVCVM
jgi:hypothetical protein